MRSRREPCQNCRKHHVKCDDKYPKCGRCEKSDRECVRAQPRWHFRHSLGTVANRPTGSASLEYVDETPRLIASYAADPEPEQPRDSPISNNAHIPTLCSDSIVPSPPPSIPSERFTSIWAPGHLQSIYHASTSPSPLPIARQTLPQLDLEEACLLRYFVEDLAKWFDHCDPERHFAVVVPQRARECPPLLDAMLSASARHFSTLSMQRQIDTTLRYGLPEGVVIPEETALRYHSRAIAHLLSVSRESDAIMDENLLAAVVILRFYEELDSLFMDLPSDTAVRGLQVFIEAQAAPALSSPGLRQAVFWVGFRQEFHMAFSQQRPFCLPLSLCEGYRPWTDAPNHIWVNRLIISAHVIQYCFDNEFQQSFTRYEELVGRLGQWLDSCPASFSPVHFQNPDAAKGALFPKVWYLDDCHIVAIQTIGLVNILLASYNPKTAWIGPGRNLALRAVDESVRSTVLEICGIALSNRQSPTSLLTACLAIIMCCDRFTHRTEQEALMDIVINMNRDNNYWPTTAMEARLKRSWAWPC